MKAFSGLVCGIVAAAGCLFTMSQNGQKIAVDEPNDLGVTSLQLDRLDENGNDVFVLRGLSAANEERASVKLTRGEIPGLARLLPGDDDEGAAVEIYAGGTVSRVVTRAADVFRIETSQLEDPAASKFVRLRAVAATPVAAKPNAASVLRDDDKAKPVFSTTRVAKPAPVKPKVVVKAKGR